PGRRVAAPVNAPCVTHRELGTYAEDLKAGQAAHKLRCDGAFHFLEASIHECGEGRERLVAPGRTDDGACPADPQLAGASPRSGRSVRGAEHRSIRAQGAAAGSPSIRSAKPMRRLNVAARAGRRATLKRVPTTSFLLPQLRRRQLRKRLPDAVDCFER